jgi:hypothetical protein
LEIENTEKPTPNARPPLRSGNRSAKAVNQLVAGCSELKHTHTHTQRREIIKALRPS